MARRKKQEEHENHERWLVSYADFITLLFAFFVVMYSLSSVNEGKYRILSDSLDAAFRAPAKSMEPIQSGRPARSSNDIPLALRGPPHVIDIEYMLDVYKTADAYKKAQQAMKEMADDIETAMSPLIDKGIISVNRNDFWIEVDINTSILFPSGSTRMAKNAVPVLRELANILKRFPNNIHVEGHTDNVPIRTKAYPSNWELSAARSAKVVRLFSRYGIDQSRMVAIGHGKNRPRANNATEDGRSKNRRVVLTVLADLDLPGGDKPRASPQDLLKQLGPMALMNSATDDEQNDQVVELAKSVATQQLP